MVKIKLLDTVLCRTPAFSPDDELEGKWEALKFIIREASPSFYEIIERVQAAELKDLSEKTGFSVWKYFNRARYRATPFGGFAAFTVMPLSADDTIPLILNHEISPRQFIDWKEKDQLTTNLSELAANSSYFQTNSSLYFIGKESRYIRFRAGYFEIVSVIGFPEFNAILNLCRQKTHPQQVYQFMKNSFRMSEKHTLTLLKRLLDLQLLTTDRFPNITGDDYFRRLNIGDTTPGSTYTISERMLISGGFNKRKLQDLPGLIGFLSAHLPKTENATLNNFKSAFLKKFERRAVPLTIAMDPETGVGYANLGQHQANQELDAFLGTTNQEEQADLQITYSPLHRFLLNGIVKRNPIRLEQFEVTGKEAALPLPNTFSVMLRFWNNQPVIENTGGCTANALLGRFTIASDELEKFGLEVSAIEEKANPDIIFFDIAYQAEKQVDNVNRRKQLYKHELPILTWSCHPSPMQLDDLLIAINGNEIILWSKKHGKRVVPRIPSAYNYTRSDLAVYRFLCDLQHQQIRSDLNFKIRHFFPGLDHYPRVVYKNVIISPAMWLVPQEFMQVGKTDNQKEKKERVLCWLQDEGIDFLFKAGSSDQTLCFDPQIDSDIAQFLLFCRQYTSKEMYISEALITGADDIKDKNGKGYAAEYIVSYSHENQVYQGGQNLALNKVNNMILPGGEWLYFEIYCHPFRSNDLLLNRIAPFIKEIGRKLKKWFFIRYDDQGPHLRLRLQLKDPNEAYLFISMLRSILEPDCMTGLVSDIQVKTYFRETERYGVARMEIVEEFFSADSKYILYLLCKKKTTDQLYITALMMMQRLIALCLNNINDQVIFVRNMADNFSRELGMGQENFKKLNFSFEQLKEQLTNNNFVPARFQGRHERLFSKIMNKCNDGAERTKMTADLLHMHINRLFFADQRAHEAILYQHLLKILKTRRALSTSQEGSQEKP
jgi:thiopeptide-type bacteriocin biosynthesis protein